MKESAYKEIAPKKVAPKWPKPTKPYPLVCIEIRGGCCVNVTGLLPHQRYEIIDYDNMEDSNGQK